VRNVSDYGSSADADRFLYGYDRAGNRLWKENDVAANLGTPVHLDELYGYDEVYRLIAADRGNLNGTQDGIVGGTAAFGQDWDLDATGNWTDFDEDTDGDGTNDLVQTRDHNEVNETGTIGATTGTNWAKHFVQQTFLIGSAMRKVLSLCFSHRKVRYRWLQRRGGCARLNRCRGCSPTGSSPFSGSCT
jgi:hypothetical protein